MPAGPASGLYAGLSSVLDLASLPDPTDKFEVQDLMGEGTYGEVYQALDKESNKEVEKHSFKTIPFCLSTVLHWQLYR